MRGARGKSGVRVTTETAVRPEVSKDRRGDGMGASGSPAPAGPVLATPLTSLHHSSSLIKERPEDGLRRPDRTLRQLRKIKLLVILTTQPMLAEW